MSPDFADWLSPMLVKELRQGMRSRMFVFSFLLLQGAMIFLAILGLAVSSIKEDNSVTTAFFWTIIGVPLLLIMPSSGLNAIGNERKANTLELIFLTRLTARRILMGKWLALVSQTGLLVCAVLPYLVLRYFLGGVNLGAELLIMVSLLLGSALLSGLTVGFSPQATRVMRALLGLGIVLGVQSIGVGLVLPFASSGVVRGGIYGGWKTCVEVALFGVILLLLMLEFGASKIAPLAENHSTSRRLLALAALLVAGWGVWQLPHSPWPFGLVMAAPVFLGALTEPAPFVASVYRPFVRMGTIGRMCGRLFYPGWPSGVFFVLLNLLAIFAVAYRYVRPIAEESRFFLLAVSVIGTVFMPAALLHFFLPKIRMPGVFYFVILAAGALLAAMAAILAASAHVDFQFATTVIPICALLMPSDVIRAYDVPRILFANALVVVLSLIVLFIKMGRPWREISALEKAAALQPAPSTDAPNTGTTA